MVGRLRDKSRRATDAVTREGWFDDAMRRERVCFTF